MGKKFTAFALSTLLLSLVALVAPVSSVQASDEGDFEKKVEFKVDGEGDELTKEFKFELKADEGDLDVAAVHAALVDALMAHGFTFANLEGLDADLDANEEEVKLDVKVDAEDLDELDLGDLDDDDDNEGEGNDDEDED